MTEREQVPRSEMCTIFSISTMFLCDEDLHEMALPKSCSPSYHYDPEIVAVWTGCQCLHCSKIVYSEKKHVDKLALGTIRWEASCYNRSATEMILATTEMLQKCSLLLQECYWYGTQLLQIARPTTVFLEMIASVTGKKDDDQIQGFLGRVCIRWSKKLTGSGYSVTHNTLATVA